MPPNDYKKDEAKAPLLSALQPFTPALYALARMMDDMQHKHRLAGSSDPFNQWAQLPNAKARMEEALERHLLPEDGTLWDVNTKDGAHLHATHGLFNLLGALTLHLRARAADLKALDAGHWPVMTPAMEAALEECCGAPDARPLHGPAGADWREGPKCCSGRRTSVWRNGGVLWLCYDCNTPLPATISPGLTSSD